MKEPITNFDINAAFRALDELEMPKATKLEKENLAESFKRVDRLSMLVEDYYNVNDTAELEEAKEDRADEIAKAKLARIEKIVDLDAESEDDILPSYVGKTIIQCPQCMTLFYKNPEDLVASEENPDVVNAGEPCQHCGNDSGYEIIGKVATAEEEAPAEDNADITLEEPEETPAEETPAEETTEGGEDLDLNLDEVPEEEKTEEAFKIPTGEALNESTDKDLDAKLKAHNDYIAYVQGQIDVHKKALENAKKDGNQEVINAIQRMIDTCEEDLKAALPDAVKAEVESADLPAADEVPEDAIEDKPEEEVKESLTESFEDEHGIDDKCPKCGKNPCECKKLTEDNDSEEEIEEESSEEISTEDFVDDNNLEPKEDNFTKEDVIATAKDVVETIKEVVEFDKEEEKKIDKAVDEKIEEIFPEDEEEAKEVENIETEIELTDTEDDSDKVNESLKEAANYSVNGKEFDSYKKASEYADANDMSEYDIKDLASYKEKHFDPSYQAEIAKKDAKAMRIGLSFGNKPVSKAIVNKIITIIKNNLTKYKDWFKKQGYIKNKIDELIISIEDINGNIVIVTDAIPIELWYDIKEKVEAQVLDYSMDFYQDANSSYSGDETKAILIKVNESLTDLATTKLIKANPMKESLDDPDSWKLDETTVESEITDYLIGSTRKYLKNNSGNPVFRFGKYSEYAYNSGSDSIGDYIGVRANSEEKLEAAKQIAQLFNKDFKIVYDKYAAKKWYIKIYLEDADYDIIKRDDLKLNPAIQLTAARVKDAGIDPVTGETDGFDESDKTFNDIDECLTEAETLPKEPTEADIAKMLDSNEFSTPVSEADVEAAIEATSEDKVEEDIKLEDLEDIDETALDEHFTKYFTEVYDNVKSFKTTDCKVDGSTLVVEGLISFNSGKNKATSFTFTANKNLLEGKNEAIADNTNFTLSYKTTGKELVVESLSYKYRIDKTVVQGCTKA